MNGDAKAKLLAEIRGYLEGMQDAQDKTAGLSDTDA